MLIYVNGDERRIPNQYALDELISSMQLAGQRFAVEVNQELVPRSSFGSFRFSEGDRVEIVQAIGGG